jgi:hypothetical protein
VRVDLLVVPDCPNDGPAGRALLEAAELAGVGELSVNRVVVQTQEQADQLGFFGSPSFFVDGRDVFPADAGSPGVACRVYATTQGPAGVPSVVDLRDALVRVCASRASAADDRGSGAGASRAG